MKQSRYQRGIIKNLNNLKRPLGPITVWYESDGFWIVEDDGGGATGSTIEEAIIAFLESFFVILPMGAVALTIGFKGPDFSQTRRARMIRQEWSLIGLIVCAVIGATVLAPLMVSAGIALFTGGAIISSYIAISVIISGAISLGITIIFYRINIGLATEFLRKAEV